MSEADDMMERIAEDLKKMEEKEGRELTSDERFFFKVGWCAGYVGHLKDTADTLTKLKDMVNG